MSNAWHYRGHRLRRIEWGLWKADDEPGRFLISYYPDGRGGRHVRRWAFTGGGISLADLKQHVRELRAGLRARKAGLPARTRLCDSLDAYLAELARRNRSDAYIVGVRCSCSRFLDYLRSDDPADVTIGAVEEFLSELQTPRGRQERVRTPRTLNKYRAHLSGWLAWAVQRRHLERNPVAAIPAAREERTFKPFPSPEQMVQLVDACEPYEAALWMVLALTGLRRASFLSLTPECFQEGGIRVPHTKRSEEWFLSYDDGCPLWDARLSAVGRSIWAARPPTPDFLRFRLDAACDRIGERWTAHGFRHAFCSWLTMIGEHMSDVAAWAHHSTVMTTERWYAHLRPHGQAQAARNRERVVTMQSHGLDIASRLTS